MKMSFRMELDLKSLTMTQLQELQREVDRAIKDKEYEYRIVSRDLPGWVAGMVLMDGKLQAIMGFRNLKGCSLLEAKSYVDVIVAEMEGNKL